MGRKKHVRISLQITWNVDVFQSRWNPANGDKWPFVYGMFFP
jgi:hypothetical protein